MLVKGSLKVCGEGVQLEQTKNWSCFTTMVLDLAVPSPACLIATASLGLCLLGLCSNCFLRTPTSCSFNCVPPIELKEQDVGVRRKQLEHKPSKQSPNEAVAIRYAGDGTMEQQGQGPSL